MVATRDVRAGEAVTLNYGALTNDEFLLDYGFLPEAVLPSYDSSGGHSESDSGTSIPPLANPHDVARLRWDLGALHAAREVAGLSAVPFGLDAARRKLEAAGALGGSGAAEGGAVPLARWQLDALRELGLEDPDPGPGGSRAKKADRELKVRRDDRDPVDPRALAGLRVLYAESPEEAFGTAGRGGGGGGGRGGGGKGGGSEEEGEKEGGDGTGKKNLASGAPRSQSALEAYALRTFQASLALAIGGFPTTAREDEATLRRHEEATKRAGGSGSEDTGFERGGGLRATARRAGRAWERRKRRSRTTWRWRRGSAWRRRGS
jgi:histone-lysine N-methyltransferase SETD3